MKPDIFGRVNIPPTCTLRWDHVHPDQRQWFCSHCRHHVHNLSAMTRREAERFMQSPSTERRCVSFLQDDEGRAIFKRRVPAISSIGSTLAWLVSAVLIMLTPGCGSAPRANPGAKSAPVSEPTARNGQVASQKNEKPAQRRWTGY